MTAWRQHVPAPPAARNRRERDQQFKGGGLDRHGGTTRRAWRVRTDRRYGWPRPATTARSAALAARAPRPPGRPPEVQDGRYGTLVGILALAHRGPVARDEFANAPSDHSKLDCRPAGAGCVYQRVISGHESAHSNPSCAKTRAALLSASPAAPDGSSVVPLCSRCGFARRSDCPGAGRRWGGRDLRSPTRPSCRRDGDRDRPFIGG